MHLDVLDFRNFYYRTALGRFAQRSIRAQVAAIWPEARQQTVAGFGFATPLLRPFKDEARRVIALMPGQQGVAHWPIGSPNVSVLCEETRWPLANGFVDKLILMHALETSETPARLLEECHRVLGPGGRALFIVPNRAGLWARRDATPFGYGRPYSLTQLENLLRTHSFTPEQHVAALFAPPSTRRFWLKTNRVWEKAGRRISSYFAGGVLLVEAVKHGHPPERVGLPEAVTAPLRVLKPEAKPVLGRTTQLQGRYDALPD